jgi:hypothetical protein
MGFMIVDRVPVWMISGRVTLQIPYLQEAFCGHTWMRL